MSNKIIKKKKKILNFFSNLISLLFFFIFTFILFNIEKNIEERNEEKIRERFNNNEKLKNSSLKEILINKRENREIWKINNGNFNNNIKIKGIYLFYIENKENELHLEEDWIPIYVGKSEDIKKRLSDHYEQIKKAYKIMKNNPENYNSLAEMEKIELKYEKISNYLITKNKTPHDIFFIILEKIIEFETEFETKEFFKEREKHWINFTGSGRKGFNSIRA